MRIRLETLVFDGMGPFSSRSEMRFGGRDRVVFYAPNGHGKTSTIDLVRWLLQGERAAPSFRALDPADMVNHDRRREGGQGEVCAIVDVEGRGRYQIRRAARPRAASTVEVAKWDEERGAFMEMPNPESVLLRFFPGERLGFNLLTGEHIREFLDELHGDAVRRSVEKLLQFPEIATANAELQAIAQELTAQRDKELRAVEKARQAAKEGEVAQKTIAKLHAEIAQLDEQVQARSRDVSVIDQEIGSIQAATAVGEQLAQWKGAVNGLEAAIHVKREDLREGFSEAWRGLVLVGARSRIDAMLVKLDEAAAVQRAWEAVRGQVSLLNDLLSKDTCVCTRPIDGSAKARIKEEIARLTSMRPGDVQESGVDDWQLRAWRDDARASQFLQRVTALQRDVGHLAKDLDSATTELKALEGRADGSGAQRLEDLRAKKRNAQTSQRALEAKKQVALESLAEQEGNLAKALQKQGKTGDAGRVGRVALTASQYAAAFRDVVERAVPWYRERLQAEVQRLFRALHQKDAAAEVALDPRTFQPHVQLPKGAADRERALTSEGEDVRLGLALLLGLREVAAEKPFLMLDAPFSKLDDEGIERLLRLLHLTDSQVIVYTKNRFKPMEFELVEAMSPKVFRMDWHGRDGGSVGHTSIREADLAVLRAVGGDKR